MVKKREVAVRSPWALRYGTAIVVVGGTVSVVLGILAVFKFPEVDRLVGEFTDEATQQRARADIRASGLALATGAAAATAGLVAWGRVQLSRQQHSLDKESRRDERFARAVELLGHNDGAVRLGSLYALESLAADGYDAQTVYDVIAAYARTRTPVDIEISSDVASAVDGFGAPLDAGTELEPDLIPAEDRRTDDYEAAITICFRAPAGVTLDLRRVVLVDQLLPARPNVVLSGARITRCDLRGSLESWTLQEARLFACRIVDAQIRDGRFAAAVLDGCEFRRTQIVGTSMHSAVIDDCEFVETTIDSTTTWPSDGVVPGLIRLEPTSQPKSRR